MADAMIADVLKAELTKYEQLKIQLLEDNDDLDMQTLLDTLEGETNVDELLIDVAKVACVKEAEAEGVAAYIAKMQARKSRLEKTGETLRNVIVMVMDRTGKKTVPSATHTLSVRDTKPKTIIEDESVIPSRFFKTPDPVLDKKMLTEELENQAKAEKSAADARARGETVTPIEPITGAKLSNGGVSLTIRIK